MSSDLPIISIVVPIYAVEAYIANCIESVISQTYRNIELLLINDGSPDRSPEICARYASQDSRIRLIHQNNSGLSGARNTGIDSATGEYIVFIDGDDRVDPGMIEVMHAAAKKYSADMVICDYMLVDESGRQLQRGYKKDKATNELLSREQALERLNLEFNAYYVIACNKLYKKTLFADKRFPLRKQHEDEFMAHELLGGCKTVVCLPEQLYYYLQRPGSIMAQGFTIGRLDAAEALINRARFFNTEGLSQLVAKPLSQSADLIHQGSAHAADDTKFLTRISELESRLREAFASSPRTSFTFKRWVMLSLFCFDQRLFRAATAVLRALAKARST